MTAPACTVVGTVVDPQGHPVPAARVYVVSAPVAMPDIAMLTDQAGRFSLRLAHAGRYEIGASSDKHGSGSGTVDATHGESHLRITLG